MNLLWLTFLWGTLASLAVAVLTGEDQSEAPLSRSFSNSDRRTIVSSNVRSPVPSHYFDRSTPPLTVRHRTRPQFTPSNNRRTRPQSPSQSVPPYAVQMEPVIQYSQVDPLYHQQRKPSNGKSQELPTINEIKEVKKSVPSQSVYKNTTNTKHSTEKSFDKQKTEKISKEDRNGDPEPAASSHIDVDSDTSPTYYDNINQQLDSAPYNQGYDQSYYIREPEPIIEIIIKESNESLPPPPTHAPAPRPRTREPVQVFYVKYKKDPTKYGKNGEESLIYDPPVPAITPATTSHLEEHPHEPPETPSLPPLPPPPTTTLRTIIHPESEVYHGTGLHVTFGEPQENNEHSRSGQEEQQQSAPQPSVIFPSPPDHPLPEDRQSTGGFFPTPHQHTQKRQPAPFIQQHQPRQPTFQRFPPTELQVPTNHQPQYRPNFQDPNFFPPQTHFPHIPPSLREESPPPPPPPPPSLASQQFNQPQISSIPPQQFHQQPQQQHFPHDARPPQVSNFQDSQRVSPQQRPPFRPLPPEFSQRPNSAQQNAQTFQHRPTFQQPHQQTLQQPQQAPFQQLLTPPQNSQAQPTFHNNFQQPPQGRFQNSPPLLQPQQFQQIPPNFQQQTFQHHQPQRFPQNNPQQQQQNVNHQLEILQQQRQQQLQEHQREQFLQHQQEKQNNFQQLQQHHQQLQQQPQRQQSHHQSLNVNQQLLQPNPTPKVELNNYNGEIVKSISKFEETLVQTTPTSFTRPQIHQSTKQQQRSPVQHEQPFHQLQNQRITQKYATPSIPSVDRRPPSSVTVPTQTFTETSKPPIFSLVPKTTSTSTKSPLKSFTPVKQQITEEPKTEKPENKTPNPAAVAALPDEIPEDLRQHLLSSGILSNADIQILDYDKIGDIPIENLPPEALAQFYGAGGGAAAAASAPIPSIVAANTSNINKTPVEMKVVQYNPSTVEGQKIEDKYVREDATQVDPVVLNDSTYNRYLPLKVRGAQFPVPDVPELRGRNVTSVVVLAPVNYDFPASNKNSSYDEDRREDRSIPLEVESIQFLAGEVLQRLVKEPTKENYRKWLEQEQRTPTEMQSIILLVASPSGQSGNSSKEIFMYDAASKKVSKLRGELSAAFVEVAEENANAHDSEDLSTLSTEVMEHIVHSSSYQQAEKELAAAASEFLQEQVSAAVADLTASGSEDNVRYAVPDEGELYSVGGIPVVPPSDDVLGSRISISSGYSKTSSSNH